jgi:hypothetical protein
MALPSHRTTGGLPRNVPQIFNLLYRSFANCQAADTQGPSKLNPTLPSPPCRLKIGGTAECNSALPPPASVFGFVSPFASFCVVRGLHTRPVPETLPDASELL